MMKFLVLLTFFTHYYCVIDHLLSVVIDSDQIEKKTISEYKGRVSKIQLTDFHPSPGLDISIIGSTPRSDTVWFLLYR